MVDLGITYRFNDTLCDLSSLFILQNEKGQLNKKVKGVGKFKGVPLDIFMQTKDEELPLTLQIRTVETGLPTSKILPFSVVNLQRRA